jgi:hypothetical protein
MSHHSSYAHDCRWTATTTFGIDTVKLTVNGVCQEPTPGYKLTLNHVELPGGEASTLPLVLTVQGIVGAFQQLQWR